MELFQVDLDNCAQEPIHIPNRIQPNGFLLAVRISDKIIIQASTNTFENIGLEVNQLLGKPLSKALYNVFSKIKQVFLNTGPAAFFHPVNVLINKKKFVCVPHSYQQNILILEFENLHSSSFLNKHIFLEHLNNGVLRIQQLADTKQLVEFTAKLVRQLTGYDRVMVYKFDQDYNGDVIAEDKQPGLYSFLHHKFPATDIPKQARELYLKNWVRIINDVDYVPVGLEPPINAVTNEFIDLSKSFLRSVSPIHIEYLKNMGVKATLTISIVAEGKLWGLIACHHYQPKFVDFHKRAGIEFLGKVLSQKWFALQTENIRRHKEETMLLNTRIMSDIRFSKDLNETLYAYKDDLLNIAEAEGLLIAYDDNILTMGKVPPKAFCTKLIHWLHNAHSYDTFCTSELYKHYPPAFSQADKASGILTVGFNVLSLCRIIWFRAEYMQSLDWGGNPNEKTLIMLDDENYRLSPRKSFNKWTEAVKNRSKDWELQDIEAAHSFKNTLSEILAWRNMMYKQQKDLLEIEVSTKTQEITRLYDQLLVQYKKLEHVAFEQSHTVRAPLATLMGLVNLLDTETEKHEVDEIHLMLKQKTAELDRVVQDIIHKL